MPDTTEIIRQYLEDAAAAEKDFEGRLRTFATEGDDQEVQFVFAGHADETRSQFDRLLSRLTALGGSESRAKSGSAKFFSLAPSISEIGHTPEERLVQNLITAYCVETGECAMYEALATVAKAAGDAVTETLAREIQAEEARTAEKVFQFLPSRSKIAFNVLTADEIDPAVETKVGMGLI